MKSAAAKRSESKGNRTGLQTAPEMAQELLEGVASNSPSARAAVQELAEFRGGYIKAGFPIGSLPSLPMVDEVKADEEQIARAVLLDKLSERLAFERMGTRLYEALMIKCEMLGEDSSGPSLEEIRSIGEDELSHFLLLKQAIEEMEGDPTVQGPSADIAGVASIGILQVVTDPRTSVTQCLQAMLTAELTDNDGWQLLIKLADGLGLQDLKAKFETALLSEEEHLAQVRGWLSERVLQKAEL